MRLPIRLMKQQSHLHYKSNLFLFLTCLARDDLIVISSSFTSICLVERKLLVLFTDISCSLNRRIIHACALLDVVQRNDAKSKKKVKNTMGPLFCLTIFAQRGHPSPRFPPPGS